MDIAETNFYRCTPRQIRPLIIDVLEAGLTPFVQADPGVGKSAIYKAVFKELMLWMIDHRMSTSEATDLSGLPQFVDGYARFAPFKDLFPIEGSVIPKGFEGWAIFLDEFNSAKKDVIAACYKLILDRMVGQIPLHKNTVICAAGNLATSRAIVNPIGTAMQSRVVHLELVVNYQEWLEDVALTENYDHRVIAFLGRYPSKLMDFNPEHKDKTFCCPRTWEFMSRLIKGKEVTDKKVPMYAGTITSEIGAEFAAFCKIYHNLVTIEDVLADPENCPVPMDNNSKWALVSMLREHVNEKNYDALVRYTDRFDSTMRIVFFRTVMIHHPKLRHHPAYIRSNISLSKYIHDGK